MAQQALGIMRSGQMMSVAVISRTYKQSILKYSQTYSLNADPEDNSEVISEMALILKKLSTEEKLGQVRGVFGLDSREYMWTIIEMPPVSQEDIRQIVEFELDSHLPVNPENVNFDAQILETTAGMNNRVALVATDKKNLES
ncbi:hypothetical protein K8T06_16460, partial [bacterium]|nr:hypothetical protein [bacterium]